jgi:hypothetical protein
MALDENQHVSSRVSRYIFMGEKKFFQQML